MQQSSDNKNTNDSFLPFFIHWIEMIITGIIRSTMPGLFRRFKNYLTENKQNIRNNCTTMPQSSRFGRNPQSGKINKTNKHYASIFLLPAAFSPIKITNIQSSTIKFLLTKYEILQPGIPPTSTTGPTNKHGKKIKFPKAMLHRC